MITLASQRYTIAAYGGTLDSRYPLGFDPSSYDFFIGPSGSDSNDGLTTDSPWAITALGSKTASIANKTVGLLDGTYNCAATTTGGNSGGIQLAANGVTVQAVNARQAIVTTNSGGSYPQTTSPVLNLIGTGVTVKDIAFHQFSWNPIKVTGGSATISGCDFSDLDMSRITGYSVGDNVGFISTSNNAAFTVTDCKFSGVSNGDSGSDNACCIGPLFDSGNVVIEYCEMRNASVAVGIKTNNPGTVTVRYCYTDITRTAIKGLTSDNDGGVLKVAHNNVFDRGLNAANAWEIGAEVSAPFQFYNNTVIATSASDGNGYAGIGVGSAAVSMQLPTNRYNQTDIYNNIFWYESGSEAAIRVGATATIPTDTFSVIDYNLYSSFKVTDSSSGGPGSTTSLATWQARLNGASVIGQEAHSTVATPVFVNSTGSNPEDYRLSAGSPGEGAGKVGGVVAGASRDMGAWGGASQIGASW